MDDVRVPYWMPAKWAAKLRHCHQQPSTTQPLTPEGLRSPVGDAAPSEEPDVDRQAEFFSPPATGRLLDLSTARAGQHRGLVLLRVQESGGHQGDGRDRVEQQAEQYAFLLRVMGQSP